jgi:hypothetical protein
MNYWNSFVNSNNNPSWSQNSFAASPLLDTIHPNVEEYLKTMVGTDDPVARSQIDWTGQKGSRAQMNQGYKLAYEQGIDTLAYDIGAEEDSVGELVSANVFPGWELKTSEETTDMYGDLDVSQWDDDEGMATALSALEGTETGSSLEYDTSIEEAENSLTEGQEDASDSYLDKLDQVARDQKAKLQQLSDEISSGLAAGGIRGTKGGGRDFRQFATEMRSLGLQRERARLEYDQELEKLSQDHEGDIENANAEREIAVRNSFRDFRTEQTNNILNFMVDDIDDEASAANNIYNQFYGLDSSAAAPWPGKCPPGQNLNQDGVCADV